MSGRRSRTLEGGRDEEEEEKKRMQEVKNKKLVAMDFDGGFGKCRVGTNVGLASKVIWEVMINAECSWGRRLLVVSILCGGMNCR